ncbi:hypothetical protein [Amycolatopsis pithecellobii]|uniref:Uncharacterized protein n=1 Tax=Amycolatopsis pithecellobii TaxID=664692 RepID=A0A6N7Z7P6_9PSEU|nr:hypothetical protein [Amycolatopsis pithecellobii]MTD57170.1 hypothetical protein [Amycolatopsis pithecellobii]
MTVQKSAEHKEVRHGCPFSERQSVVGSPEQCSCAPVEYRAGGGKLATCNLVTKLSPGGLRLVSAGIDVFCVECGAWSQSEEEQEAVWVFDSTGEPICQDCVEILVGCKPGCLDAARTLASAD